MVIPTTDGLIAVSLPSLVAPDGAMDMARSVGDTAALGLGVAAIAPRTPGATEVMAAFAAVTATETTRRTFATPGSGLRIRVLYILFNIDEQEATNAEVYFGTGANIASNPASAVASQIIGLETTNETAEVLRIVYPDGAGPIGAVDEVLSTRLNVLDNHRITIGWREE